MTFSMSSPCLQCPFLKSQGYLTKARAREIATMMASTQGGTFPCHKTTSHDDEGETVKSDNELHCAGALLFMEKVNEGGTQMVRIAERLGMYDRRELTGAERVYDSVRQMIAGHGR